MRFVGVALAFVLAGLGSCTAADAPPVSIASQDLRWAELPQEGGGFGVPDGWKSTSGSGMHFAMLAAASDGDLVDDLVTPYNDNGVSIRGVSLYDLEEDDAFVDMTVSVMLSFPQRHDVLPRFVTSEDFDETDERLGAPVHELSGWRSRNQNVTVRYWIGPDASEETRAQLAAILERIELP